MKKISVLIVDDSALIREIFSEIISSEQDMVVVGTASDPFEARDKIKLLNPDVITLDIEMPKMDGLSFLERIMSLRPMPVVMASTLTQKGADTTIRALELGAFDYVSKPINNHSRDTIGALKYDLVAKVRAAAISNIQPRKTTSEKNAILAFNPLPRPQHNLIAIGASTGGVEALRDVLIQLPRNTPPIVISQHMPEKFTASFAARLNSLAHIDITEATHHGRLKPGSACIAPGDRHLKIVKIGGEYVCKLDDGPPVSNHKPSVDVMFDSVAEAAGNSAIGIILTGMGKDGAAGLRKMRDAGARTLGQDERSCVVYGMPKVAKQLGGVEIEVSLHNIPKTLLQLCEH